MIRRFVVRRLSQTAALILPLVALLSSCGVKMMPTKDAWFTQHYPIMQDFERSAYRTLSEAGKTEFQTLFWAARDPGSKSVFEERLGYVISAYKRENSRQPWNTDRARIYLLNGPPAAIEVDQNTDWGVQIGQPANVAADRSNEDVQAYRAEVWTYALRSQNVKYVFTFKAPNEWKMSPAAVSGNRFIGEFERDNKAVTFGIRDLDRYQRDLEALGKK